MNRVEIEHKIKSQMSSLLLLNEDTIKNTATLDSLGTGYVEMMEIVMAIEEEFGIEIPDTDTDNIKTVQDLINYVCDKKLDPPRY